MEMSAGVSGCGPSTSSLNPSSLIERVLSVCCLAGAQHVVAKSLATNLEHSD